MIISISAYTADMSSALRQHWIWRPLSHHDLRRRFRRSVFGVLWIVFQQMFFAVGAGLLWSTLFGVDARSFIPFVASGLAVWSFITGSYTSGCSTFSQAQVYLKQIPVNSSIFIYRMLYTNLVILFIGVLTSFFLVSILLPQNIGWGTLLVLPGIGMVAAAAFVTTQTLAYIGMRFRDVQHALPSLFQLLFVLTPILYPIDILRARGLEITEFINPFTSIIEVIRAPLINGVAAQWPHYAIVIAYIVVFQVLSVAVHARWKHEMPYWL